MRHEVSWVPRVARCLPLSGGSGLQLQPRWADRPEAQPKSLPAYLGDPEQVKPLLYLFFFFSVKLHKSPKGVYVRTAILESRVALGRAVIYFSPQVGCTGDCFMLIFQKHPCSKRSSLRPVYLLMKAQCAESKRSGPPLQGGERIGMQRCLLHTEEVSRGVH